MHGISATLRANCWLLVWTRASNGNGPRSRRPWWFPPGETFETVAREWMARQTVARVTAEKNRWLLETFLFPEIGSRSIGEITPRELLDALRKIEATGKLETAGRAKINVGQVFRYAMLEGKAEIDPTASLRGALKTVKARHHAAITDPVKIGQLLRAIEGFIGQPVTHAALKLAPLVFVRPGELRAAEWGGIDLDAAMWRIRPERMKMKAAHLVPLSSQAVVILRDLHALTGGGPMYSPACARTALCRKTPSMPRCAAWAIPVMR